MKKENLVFLPLGGTGEIGMNVNLYHYMGKWLMIDCGAGFADQDIPGVDIIVADISFIQERKEDLVGILITHAPIARPEGQFMRSIELISLKKNDVQPLLNDQTYIIITGKGKKERIILFSEKAILALKKYLELQSHDSVWLFPAKKVKRSTKDQHTTRTDGKPDFVAVASAAAVQSFTSARKKDIEI